MQPQTVYTNAVRSGTIRSAKELLDSLPTTHQCVACGMILDQGPLYGLFPTDSHGRLVRLSVKDAVLNWCPRCAEEHDQIMAKLEG